MQERLEPLRPSEDPSSRARLDELESSLQEELPELVVLDRELEIDERTRADLVGIDASGRPVLVLVVDGTSEATPAVALEVLVWARGKLGLLARHLGASGARSDAAPRVVLVAERFAEAVRARLAPLARSGVESFTVERVRSARGEQTYLIPVDPERCGEAGASVEGRDGGFVSALSSELRPLGRLLLARLERIDDEIEVQPSRNAVAWIFRGEELAAVRAVDGRFEGRVPAGDRPASIRSAADVEAFVEDVLVGYVQRLDLGNGHADAGALDAGAGILTAEEIEAFRE